MKKNIYILGGNGLIGKELVKLYSKENVKIIVLDIEEKKILKKNKRVKFIKFNCIKNKTSQKKLEKIFYTNGKPDVFINCTYPVTKSWSKSTINNFNYTLFKNNIEAHMNSYIWIAKIVAKEMKKYNYGAITLLGSIYGPLAQDPLVYKDTGIDDNYTYPVIKAGILGATKQLASFYGKYNIRVNCVCPGGIKGHVKGTKKKQNIKFQKKYLSKTLLKRFCKSDEAAKVCKFFSSDMASYVTGQTIFVDGGYSIL